MRYLRAVLPLLLTTVVVWLLDRPLGALPPLGRLLDPATGALAAAEPVDADWNRWLHLDGLAAPVAVWLDTSLIPHIRAGNDHDLYYVQGYVHASFRLWQMDMQTRAAGGRVSEVAGPKALDFDRGMRREGMVWGAQRSLDAMERDPRTRAMLAAYRDGINAFIGGLNYRTLPLEYKLMCFEPEPWTNLRTALLMKYMARDLTGKTDDVAFTQLRDRLGQAQFDFLFPERTVGSMPVIPEGTPFAKPSLAPPPVPGDSVWAHFGGSRLADTAARTFRNSAAHLPGQATDDAAVGSNNWAVSGKHTASGKPILCNDPHLGLNLPSLWYEMQLTAPGINVYGASLPGAPGVVIGFNEKVSWGFTNNYRDVKDFYRIEPATPFIRSTPEWPMRPSYRFGTGTRPFEEQVERIKVRGKPDVLDTVLYTVHGPVTYDPSFPGSDSTGALLACTWMGHRPSNELLSVYLLNRAGDYRAFTQAISYFECPAQNFAYADGVGNIAMWGQGRFINKWKGQGKFVMEGRDSSALWGTAIPWEENPHVLNPPQGYVASANQQVTDSTYPYWYNQSATEWRSWEINFLLLDKMPLAADALEAFYSRNSNVRFPRILCRMPTGEKPSRLTMADMQQLQNATWSLLNWNLIFRLEMSGHTADAGGFGAAASAWSLGPKESGAQLTAGSRAGTRLQIFWATLQKAIWEDEFEITAGGKFPSSERTMYLLRSDSSSRYYDDLRTPHRETLRDLVRRSSRDTDDSLRKLQPAGLEWYRVKNTTLTHLAKIPAFSYDHLKIGGWGNTINAVTGNHGPSWRMIVEMDAVPKAYAIYPGGQSGNPGSRHYGDFIDAWVEGRYHAVQFLTAAVARNPLPYTWTLNP